MSAYLYGECFLDVLLALFFSFLLWFGYVSELAAGAPTGLLKVRDRDSYSVATLFKLHFLHLSIFD